MAHNASDCYSRTLTNVVDPTATWQSDQSSENRGFTIFAEG